MNKPTLHHPYCKESRCDTCLDDSLELMHYLEERIGRGSRSDWLGEYRYWLDYTKKFPDAETEYGWFNPEVFSNDLVEEFIEYKTAI